MAKSGELRWKEDVVIENGVVVQRTKTLQQYVYLGWGAGYWSTVPTEKEYHEYETSKSQTSPGPVYFNTAYTYGGNVYV